jgi:hypothetical protein
MKFKFSKSKKVYKKGSSVINPNKYWNWVLVVTGVMVVLAFGFGFFVLKEVNDEATFQDQEEKGVARKTQKDRINKVLEYFQTKENKAKDVTGSPSPVIDPSL